MLGDGAFFEAYVKLAHIVSRWARAVIGRGVKNRTFFPQRPWTD